MSRGSKPGERRGGRKLGTPNKKTLLRHAFIDAVAADRNLLPLHFFLRLMHQPRLPLAIRVHAAEEALPCARQTTAAKETRRSTSSRW